MIHKLLHFKNEIFIMIYIYILYHSDIYICHAIDLKSFSVMGVSSLLLVIHCLYLKCFIYKLKNEREINREKKGMDNNIEKGGWKEKKNYNREIRNRSRNRKGKKIKRTSTKVSWERRKTHTLSPGWPYFFSSSLDLFFTCHSSSFTGLRNKQYT